MIKIGFINKPIPQKKFPDCKDKSLLRFDIGLENSEHGWTLIEFHGGQHYFPVEFWGGEKSFKERQNRDRIKEKYCKDNNFPLIVIPYWELNNIDNIFNRLFFER